MRAAAARQLPSPRVTRVVNAGGGDEKRATTTGKPSPPSRCRCGMGERTTTVVGAMRVASAPRGASVRASAGGAHDDGDGRGTGAVGESASSRVGEGDDDGAPFPWDGWRQRGGVGAVSGGCAAALASASFLLAPISFFDDDAVSFPRGGGGSWASTATTTMARMSAPLASSSPVPARQVPFSEVASHDTEDACYMGLAIGRTSLDHDIIVYDMTSFLRRHPGGFTRVRRNCGKVNCTWEMRYKGHKFFARNDTVLRMAVEARGGQAVGRLGDFEGGACME